MKDTFRLVILDENDAVYTVREDLGQLNLDDFETCVRILENIRHKMSQILEVKQEQEDDAQGETP